MDPNSTNQLDTKLREAYNRIMGFGNANSVAPSIAVPNVPVPNLVKEANNATPVNQSSKLKEEIVKPKSDKAVNETGSLAHGFIAKRNDKKISPVIIISAIATGIILYTLFWLKLFKVI